MGLSSQTGRSMRRRSTTSSWLRRWPGTRGMMSEHVGLGRCLVMGVGMGFLGGHQVMVVNGSQVDAWAWAGFSWTRGEHV